MRAMGTLLEQQLQKSREEIQHLTAAAAVAAANQQQAVPGPSSSPRSANVPAGTKLKPPPMTQFSGSNGMGFQVVSWLRSVQKQFDWHGPSTFPDQASKIKFATMFLDGAALEWWDSLDDQEDITTYEEFVQRMHDRYKPRLAGEVARQNLSQLHQTGNVSQLCSRMLTLLTHVPTMHEDDKIFIFKRALKRDIAVKVAEKEPATLHEAMGIAVLAEQYVGPAHSSSKSNNYFFAKQGYGNFGRGGPSSSSSSTTPMEVNSMEAEMEFNEVDQPPPAENDNSAVPHQLLAMMQKLDAQQQVMAAAYQKHRGAPHRGPNVGGKPGGNNNKVPGISKEEYERCRKEGLCLKCKQTGHLARDCSKPVQRLKW
jgi:hypothetical protein